MWIGVAIGVVGLCFAIFARPLAGAFIQLGSERTERASLRSAENIQEMRESLRSPDTHLMFVWGLRVGGLLFVVIGIISVIARH